MTWQGHPRTSTTAHRKWRAQVLATHPLCQCPGCPHCTTPNQHCSRPSTEADHITPWSQQGPPTLDNGRGVCKPCHQHKSSREGAQARWRNRAQRTPEPHPGIT